MSQKSAVIPEIFTADLKLVFSPFGSPVGDKSVIGKFGKKAEIESPIKRKYVSV